MFSKEYSPLASNPDCLNLRNLVFMLLIFLLAVGSVFLIESISNSNGSAFCFIASSSIEMVSAFGFVNHLFFNTENTPTDECKFSFESCAYNSISIPLYFNG